MSALLLPACGGQDAVQRVELLDAPVALDSHVVWIDEASQQALVLDVGKKSVSSELSRYQLPTSPKRVWRRAQHNELLLLSYGGDAGEAELSRISDKEVVASFPIGARFDVVSQSSDGRYAIAWFSGNRDEADDSLLFNPNEIAIVDLENSPDQAVATQSLRGLGAAPRGVIFSPAMQVGDKSHRLALVLYDSHVVIIDVEHPERPAYTVEFSAQQGIGLNRVVFGSKEGKFYLLAQNSSDVFVVSLSPAGSNRKNDFEPSLNQLGAGARPTDMVPYGEGAEARLLAVSDNALLIIEAGANRVTPIALEHRAQSVLLFQGTSPSDSAVRQRALVYGSSGDRVTFVDLDNIEERTSRNLESVRVHPGQTAVSRLDDGLVLLARSNGLSLLNLERRATSELTAISNVAVVPTPDLRRIWVPDKGAGILGYVDYSSDSNKTNQVKVDGAFEHVLFFTEGEYKRVVLVHSSTAGRVTVLDASEPRNGDAVALRGLFYPAPLDQQ